MHFKPLGLKDHVKHKPYQAGTLNSQVGSRSFLQWDVRMSFILMSSKICYMRECISDTFSLVCVCVCVHKAAPALWHLVIFFRFTTLPLTPFTQNQTECLRQNDLYICRNHNVPSIQHSYFPLFFKLKNLILSLFTLPCVVPNLYGFLSSTEHKRWIAWWLFFCKMKVDHATLYSSTSLLNTFVSFVWGKDWI